MHTITRSRTIAVLAVGAAGVFGPALTGLASAGAQVDPSTFNVSLISAEAVNDTTVQLTFEYASPAGSTDQITWSVSDLNPVDVGTGAATDSALTSDGVEHEATFDVPIATDAVHNGDQAVITGTDTAQSPGALGLPEGEENEIVCYLETLTASDH
jgi:hypothetical protein